MKWNNKVILLTGGTGSFGYQFVETMLKEYNPKSIRIFSRDEFKQHEMIQTFKADKRLHFVLGDVRDTNRVSLAMRGVDVVVHAAALKQVPMCEYHPFEAIQTNIIGTQNIIHGALLNKVSKVMSISSDKAVNPINLYGATKLCAEKLIIQGNTFKTSQKTVFSFCRYGNVLGSRGSVIEMFKKQKKEGKMRLTDKRMTRFWLTIEEGIKFVISCIERMEGGEIFVPKIPSMKLIDMVKALAPDTEVEEIGLRPGEKIHEALISEDESRYTLEFPDCYVVHPTISDKKITYFVEGKSLPEGFSYRSNTNTQWLTSEQLHQLIQVKNE